LVFVLYLVYAEIVAVAPSAPGVPVSSIPTLVIFLLALRLWQDGHLRLSRAKRRSPRQRARTSRRPQLPTFLPRRHDLQPGSARRAAVVAGRGRFSVLIYAGPRWSRSRAAALARYVILVYAPDVQDHH
jgi:hypothetical protein